MQKTWQARLLKLLGLLLCVLPPAITALTYFPLWIGKTDSALSVMAILVLSLCALPFWRVLRDALRSPSAWMMWLILFLALSLLESLCEGLRVVALVGCPTSLLGAVCFYFAKRIGEGQDA